MQSTEIASSDWNSRFRGDYGDCADLWLVDDLLPLAGVALIEAADLKTAAMVAEDIGSMIPPGFRWGDRMSLPGHVIEFDTNGAGRYIERIGDNPALPALDLSAVVQPMEFYTQILDQGGANLVILHLPHDVAIATGTGKPREGVRPLVNAMNVARELECCALIVTDTLGNPDAFRLRAVADTVLAVAHAATATESGTIVQTKGRATRGTWTYTMDVMSDFQGAKPVIDSVWENPRNVQ